MKLSIIKGIIIASALATIWGTFEPWLLFSGEIEHVLIGSYQVSGYIFGFGFGSLSSSSASVSVSSSEQFSTSSSDFWFGLFPLTGGVLNLILAWGLERTKNHRATSMIAIVSCIASILGCFLFIFYYTPYVFAIHGQIDSLMINGAFLYAENANISVGIGPLISIIASIMSSGTYLILQWKTMKEH
ncbi:MAG: hypothetical protein P1Q69_15900 [Candidatus Thorarchaeota archaeon]|nr:hypothetical protein [Candidatus Thorarchaeota archaeon]